MKELIKNIWESYSNNSNQLALILNIISTLSVLMSFIFWLLNYVSGVYLLIFVMIFIINIIISIVPKKVEIYSHNNARKSECDAIFDYLRKLNRGCLKIMVFNAHNFLTQNTRELIKKKLKSGVEFRILMVDISKLPLDQIYISTVLENDEPFLELYKEFDDCIAEIDHIFNALGPNERLRFQVRLMSYPNSMRYYSATEDDKPNNKHIVIAPYFGISNRIYVNFLIINQMGVPNNEIDYYENKFEENWNIGQNPAVANSHLEIIKVLLPQQEKDWKITKNDIHAEINKKILEYRQKFNPDTKNE